MRHFIRNLCAAVLMGTTATATAGAQEIVVTASRSEAVNNGGGIIGIIAPTRPVIALKRTADFVVIPVRVSGDTRDANQRGEELRGTIRAAMAAAGRAGIELSVGSYVLLPLTADMLGALNFQSDGRPDTGQTTILAKVRVAPGVGLDEARQRVERFVKSVSPAGRTKIEAFGGPILSMVNPDQYRGQIIDMIAADAAASAAKFGTGSGVDVSGLDRPVEWTRAGPVEVFLYLPAAYTVRKS